MYGYVELPFYNDKSCTDLYKILKIPVIDLASANIIARQNINYMSLDGNTTVAYIGGFYDNQPRGKFQYSDFGTSNGGGPIGGYARPNVDEDTDRIKNIMKTTVSSVMDFVVSNIQCIKDNINLISLITTGINGTYYIKNGSYVRINHTYNPSTYDFVTISFFDSLDTNLFNFTITTNVYSSGGLYRDLNFIEQPVNEFNLARNQSWDLRFFYTGTYIFYPIFINSNLKWSDISYSNSFSIFYSDNFGGEGRQYLSNSYVRTTTTAGAYNNTFFTRFLGLADGISSVDQIVNDLELIFKKDTEDKDNTYPGGGDDKNIYPDDDDTQSGKGDFDNTNDPIDFPTLPIWDVQSTGFISIWNPTALEVTNLYGWLWNADESILDAFSTTLKKMFSNPMEAIFSLGLVPVDIPTDGKRQVSICHIDTGIEMNSVQSQFVTFDFGSVDCTEYYGAAWDYSPYTKASIYLPYIGIMDIDVDDVMNCTLTLRYNVDIVTGTVVALLKCKRKGRDNLDAVMYEWQGNCMTQCPITASDWSQKMASVLQLGAMTGLALMQPRAGQSTQNGEQNENPAEVGRQLVSPSQYLNSALNVITSKVHVQRGGRLDLSAGAMSMQSAFLILNRPISAIPRGWSQYAGYPSLKIKRLGSQEGFTKVAAIKLNGLQATSEELQELDTILKAGVIL